MTDRAKQYSEIVSAPRTLITPVPVGVADKSIPALNIHIEEYLLHYIAHPTPPRFAVLLKGLWGSGKTWFVDDFLARNGLRERTLLVSLYGVTSFADIEAEWFRQLHPFLASKGMMLAGRILKGALKTGIKLNLDDGMEGSAESSLPDLKLQEILAKSPRSILVFDDLERCSIRVSDVLGYINQLVEKGGYRAILLANEAEIAARDSQESERLEYERVKEKLIGKTFVIRPDAFAAIAAFLPEMQDARAKHAIERSLVDIQNIYEKSGKSNLRYIRQVLLDMDRIIPKLGAKVLGNGELISHFIILYLIYSIEIRSKAISAKDITGSYQARLLAQFNRLNKSQEPPPGFLNIVDKYGDYPLDETLLEAKLWAKLIDDSLEVSTEVNEALLNSSYFQSEERPAWVKLWHHNTLSDDEAEQLISKVAEDFYRCEADDLGVVRHMFGLLLTFSKNGLYSKSTEELSIQARRYIDHLKACGKLPLGKANVEDSFGNSSAYGLGFCGSDLAEFRAFNKYISDSAEDALENDRPAQVEKLLEETLKDSTNFYRAVVLTAGADSRYHEFPILKYIKPMQLVEAILQLNGKHKMIIARAIRERYRDDRVIAILASERPFLASVAELLTIEGKSRVGKISGIDLLELSKSFATAAEKLPLPKPE